MILTERKKEKYKQELEFVHPDPELPPGSSKGQISVFQCIGFFNVVDLMLV